MGVTDVFLDTNLLVYAHDTSEVQKGPKAHALLAALFAAGQPVVGVQAVSEFYWTVTRKIRNPLSHDDAVAESKRIALLARIVPTTWDVFETALDLVKRYPAEAL
jgi:predicted nucleic acid-binding protein